MWSEHGPAFVVTIALKCTLFALRRLFRQLQQQFDYVVPVPLHRATAEVAKLAAAIKDVGRGQDIVNNGTSARTGGTPCIGSLN